MKDLAIKFLSDDHGNPSSTRIKSSIALVVAIILSFRGAGYELIIAWLVAAFAPQAIQKFAERK